MSETGTQLGMEEIGNTQSGKSESEVEPVVKFITGIAGSGKTFSVKKEIEDDPKAGLLTATTGIAAVNLGSITLHSALGMRPDSIEDDYQTGKLKRAMHQIAKKHRALLIDECSMLGGREMLDILYLTAREVNEYADVKERFGITLIGDFCQLPPIKQSWAFEADCWGKFAENTVRLTKNWRQGEGPFVDALNLLRGGKGRDGAALLKSSGVHFEKQADPNFDGTTIVGTNDEVDRYNNLRFLKLAGIAKGFPAYRRGRQRSEWMRNIPDSLAMKEKAYVMILSNDTSRDPITKRPLFRWVNGDCGHVVEMGASSVRVEVLRTKAIEEIRYVERENGGKFPPEGYSDEECERAKERMLPLADGTYWDDEKRLWIQGTVKYLPVRLAYATSVHKSQGLTLDKCQIDLRNSFVGRPAMVYVSASRCRTAGGLHLIGDGDLVTRRCSVDPKVRAWL